MRLLLTLCLLPVLGTCTDAFDSLAQRAEEARAARNVSAACDLYQQALALKPDWSGGWWYLGNLLFVSNKYAAAEDALHHFTDLRPDLAEGWGMRGMAALQAHSYDDALAFMEKSLSLPFAALAGIKPVIETNHAFLLSRVGRFDDALDALRLFAHKDPDAELLNALGVAALHRKQMPGEVPLSERALTEAAGRVQFEMIAADRAAPEAAEALADQYPHEPGVHYLAGMALFATQPDRAEVEFSRELNLDPQNAAAESMLAYTQFALHKLTPHALDEAQDAVNKEPSNAGYEYVLGVLQDAEGKSAAAIQCLEKAAQFKPLNVEYHVALAASYNKAGQYAKGDQERRLALKLKFGNAG